MRLLLGLIAAIISTGVTFATPVSVFASYEQAYGDYLYQFDQYRRTYTDFQVAKNEYKKFKTLTSETTALDKTKTMLWQRDQLYRAYLLVLLEKVNGPDSGLQSNIVDQYRRIITSEIAFLESHGSRISSLGSIEDAVTLSKQLESHSMVLETSIRQILTGLSLGQLAILAKYYDALESDARSLVTSYAYLFAPNKQETINRWVLQIGNKRAFYQQKIDAITLQNVNLDPHDRNELDTQYNQMVRGMSEARQYLVEGISFMGEFRDAIKFAD